MAHFDCLCGHVYEDHCQCDGGICSCGKAPCVLCHCEDYEEM